MGLLPRHCLLAPLLFGLCPGCGRIAYETLETRSIAADSLSAPGTDAGALPGVPLEVGSTSTTATPGAAGAEVPPASTSEGSMSGGGAPGVGAEPGDAISGSAGTGTLPPAGGGGAPTDETPEDSAAGGSAGASGGSGSISAGGEPGATDAGGAGGAATGGDSSSGGMSMAGAAGAIAAGGAGGSEGGVLAPAGIDEGLTAWFDASTTSFSDGALVDAWANAIQSDPSAMPTFVADGINGQPVIRFDGDDDVLVAQGFEGLTDFDVFTVWQSPILPPTNAFTHIVRHGSEVTENFELTHGSPYDAHIHSGGMSSSGDFYSAKFEPPAVNTPYLWNVTYESSLGDLTARTDGVVTAVNDGDPRVPDVGEAVLGLGGRPGPNRFFTGDIAEVIIYDRVLDDAERDALEAHLADKWGLPLP